MCLYKDWKTCGKSRVANFETGEENFSGDEVRRIIMGFIGFDMFRLMFSIVFFMVMATFIMTFVKGISQWNKNNNSPRLTVPAVVVAKRTNVSHHHHNTGINNHQHYHTSTTYYVTFQVESGDRMELKMSGSEYGLLVEGDAGMLSFQGTRYLGFERV